MKNLIQENIMLTLGKLITALSMKSVEKAMDKLPDDPEIKAAEREWKKANKDADILRKRFCQAHPDHPKCKEKSEIK